jgi:hypothetical protein
VCGTKGKDQWQASERWYQCFKVKKHHEADYQARDHVEGTSNLVEDWHVSCPTYVGGGSVNEDSVNEGSCPSPRPRSAKPRAESNKPPDSDYDDA